MDLSGARWRKSSRSGSDGGECVEVALVLSGSVAVRDSKNLRRPALVFSPDAWKAFVRVVKLGGLPVLPRPRSHRT
ncbi:DUF397 domain-containing protein [Sphaerisporangium album]|uniref:DUF397 domain-containing protein n=1 Tax=Sphaerisporangium album TaxID=509200 RepID=A0A367F533_9ACTN|nr:DUF397 domain-containing protein [Sphaerisporangium album]RCG25039.1 DUF397 domain-containing protein [Sphaerisporangium album]